MEEKTGTKRKATKPAGKKGPSKRPNKTKVKQWCATCWVPLASKCSSKGHPLLDVAEAQAQAKSAVSEAQAEMDAVQTRLQDQLARLYAVEEALEKKRVVIQALAEPDEECEGPTIQGGVFKIVLAVDDVTPEEAKALCECIDGVDFRYELEVDGCLPQSFLADIPESLFEKLPEQPAGVAVRKGTVLVTAPKGSDDEESEDECEDESDDEEDSGDEASGKSKKDAGKAKKKKVEDSDKSNDTSGEAAEDDSGDSESYANYCVTIYTMGVKPQVKRLTKVLGRVSENLPAVALNLGECCFDKERGGGNLIDVSLVEEKN